MEDVLGFQRRQTVGARLAGASVTKTATFIGCIQSDGKRKSWEDVIS